MQYFFADLENNNTPYSHLFKSCYLCMYILCLLCFCESPKGYLEIPAITNCIRVLCVTARRTDKVRN